MSCGDAGATLLEYLLLVVFVALASLGAAWIFGGQLNATLRRESVASRVSTAALGNKVPRMAP